MSDGDSGHRRWTVVGGAGFIGSHFVDRLLADESVEAVTVYDNLTSGREEFVAQHQGDARFSLIEADVADAERLATALSGMDAVIHLAANPDIARAASEPAIDFDQGTVLTQGVIEAMRKAGCSRVLYASGSGVYGDLGETRVDEDFGPLNPISTYGASKLASEAMIAAYVHMFGLTARIFRFANVVGPRQTHGVGLDFIAKLRRDPTHLDILGDGSQSKPYIHVDNVIDAVLLADARAEAGFAVFNVAPDDAVTVAEIADLAAAALGLDAGMVEYRYTGGARGWAGDVPVVRLNCDRIKALGWQAGESSLDAVRRSLGALAER